MTYLAFHNLWQQKFRLSLSVGGVALAMMLIIILNGFLAGISKQVTAYLDNTPATFVVAQDGVNNMLGATSLLPASVEDLVRGVRGVEQVIPIITQYVILDIDDKKVVSYMVGYDPDLGGGPWQLAVGRTPEDDDEVVLDEVMAQEHGFALGDSIEILDEEFTVVGLSSDTNSWMASFFFLEKRAAERLLLTPDTASFILLTLAADADANQVEARLRRRLRNVELLSTATVKENDVNLLVEVFAIPLRLMVVIAFGVGTAILGMIIYTATVERMREYGVLKAMGARNRHLYWLVVQQGMATAFAGMALGIGLAWAAALWIMGASPKFLILLQPDAVLMTATSGVIMGLLAALAPARHVARLDPAQVFRKM